jgi:phospholipid/cholesterol/gamma-HCH transport system substrate-binding protein
MARHNPAELATGAVVLAVAGGFLLFAVANTGRSFGRTGYVLHASFDHVDGLSTGADVRIAGVKVGSVQAISLDRKTFEADVSFTMQDGVHLTTDSSATVATDGLLGGKYVAIADGGEDKIIPPGGTVTITQGSVNLEALLGKYIFGGPGTGKSGGAAGSGAANGGAGAKGAQGAQGDATGDGIAPLK